MFVSSHNGRFLRGDLPNNPIESQAGYTKERASSHKRSNKSKHGAQSPVHWQCGELGVGLKPGGYINGRCPVECKSGRAQSVTHDIAQLEHWMARAMSSYSPERWMSHSFQCPGRVLIQVSGIVLGVPDTSRGTPVTPYCFSLDIALDITSYWIVKGVQKQFTLLLLY
uniref:Uncharacterized protein n=1 Tax=Pipistrellus kuhlii TaxID=59472 RepID=A0A7J8A7W6_PIPKU|nr:hypothetical protein mPipKuh1_008886 [Pipistrellus kuhlii]